MTLSFKQMSQRHHAPSPYRNVENKSLKFKMTVSFEYFPISDRHHKVKLFVTKEDQIRYSRKLILGQTQEFEK